MMLPHGGFVQRAAVQISKRALHLEDGSFSKTSFNTVDKRLSALSSPDYTKTN